MNCNKIMPVSFPVALIVRCWYCSSSGTKRDFVPFPSPLRTLHDAVIFYYVHFMFSLHYDIKILLLSYHHKHNSIIFPTHPPQPNPLLGDPVIIRGPFLESPDN